MREPLSLDEYRNRPLHAERREGGRRVRGKIDSPLISVVTAVLNRKDSIERAIQSVLSQPLKNVEHVIIDGGSTDGTLDVLQKYDEQLAYWSSEPDGGIFDAMNKGVALARGQYIHLLNSDDYYCAGALQVVAN